MVAIRALEPEERADLQRGLLTAMLDGLSWLWLLLFQVAVIWWIFTAFEWTDHAWLALSWGILLSSLLIGQSFLALRFSKRQLAASVTEVDSRLVRFGWSLAAVGLLWALGLAMLFQVASEQQRLYIVFATIGLAGVQIAMQHRRPIACYPVVLLPMLALTGSYALTQHWLIAGLLLLLASVAIRLIQRLAAFSEQSAALHIEQRRLLDLLAGQTQSLSEAKQSADSANASKSRFLAQASHDLRQPLHAIGLFVETIAQDQLDGREVAVGKSQAFDRVQQSLAMLSKLFDNLLDITALDTQEVSVTPVNIAVQDLFDQLAVEFEPVAQQLGVVLRFKATKVVVRSDYVLIRRLLQNLVANAIRYSPGGSVLVGLRRGTKRSLKFQVYDTGIGIPSCEKKRVFDEFVRLQNPATERESTNPGLGLGLSIVQRLAKALLLEVGLTSVEGRGSVFTVSGIQLGDGEPTRLEETQEQGAMDLLEGTRVLVIDDDAVVLQATGDVLRRWGCEVQLSQTAPEQLAEVDVVISDHELADGRTGLVEIARLGEKNDFAAVLITGNSSPELQEMARQAQVPLLHKPVRPIQLRSALLHALSVMAP